MKLFLKTVLTIFLIGIVTALVIEALQYVPLSNKFKGIVSISIFIALGLGAFLYTASLPNPINNDYDR